MDPSDWERYSWAVWLGLAIALGTLELFTLDLVLLMLGVGAVAGMAVDLVGLDLPWQILAAVATSVAMLALVRPTVLRRLHSGPDLVQGHQALVGEEGFAVAEVTAQGGQIKIRGEVWTARPYDDTAVIPVGARVRVFEIRGATAYVDEVPSLGS